METDRRFVSLTPKTDCKECGFEGCAEFATHIQDCGAKLSQLRRCPYLSVTLCKNSQENLAQPLNIEDCTETSCSGEESGDGIHEAKTKMGEDGQAGDAPTPAPSAMGTTSTQSASHKSALQSLLDHNTEARKQEKIVISEQQTIPPENQRVISQSHVSIETYIKVYGELSFEDCTIVFRETYGKSQIELFDIGQVTFKNCKIICPAKQRVDYFTIFSEDSSLSDIIFEGCTIYGAKSFISTKGKTQMRECVVKNAPKGFISFSYAFTMDKCKMLFKDPPQFYNGQTTYGSVINIGDKRATSYIKNTTVAIESQRISDTTLFGHSLTQSGKSGIFEAAITVNVENCTFINIKANLFYLYSYDTRKFSLTNCKFIGCKRDIISGTKRSNCTFE